MWYREANAHVHRTREVVSHLRERPFRGMIGTENRLEGTQEGENISPREKNGTGAGEAGFEMWTHRRVVTVGQT